MSASESVSVNEKVTLVEVGPRDGFQPIAPFIPTATKIAVLEGLYASGIRRVEATAFVSAKAVPQLADAAQVLAAARKLGGLKPQVLVPNERYANEAVAAGAGAIAFVVSVSEKHNRNNVRRSPQESVKEFAKIAARLAPTVKIRLNLATAFDCPFDGPVLQAAVLAILDELIAVRADAEYALCDTTGRVTPDRVGTLFTTVRTRYPGVKSWAFHGHDTYGLGIANVLAAHAAGVRIFDSSIAGLGGCPFAPGATGNVATEDLVWTFGQMGVDTGIFLPRLIKVADLAAGLDGAATGGRVRTALAAARCRRTETVS